MEWLMLGIEVFGGLSLFLYGMYLVGEGIKKSAAHHLKNFLTKVTKNQLSSALVGIIMAAVLQSSTAATVMVVGFVNTGIMPMRKALGVVLGAAIGTTFTVQLIAFKITDYALLFVGLGVFLFIVSTKKITKFLGEAVIGFGFINFGTSLIVKSMNLLHDNPHFTNWVASMNNDFIFIVLIAIFVTILLNNSAATIAIAMALASSGMLGLKAGLGVVYGANVGMVVTALIASLYSSKDAQRTAVAHALFKIIGVLYFLPLSDAFVTVLEYMGGNIERKIANAHTFFNIVNLLILLPFCDSFANLMKFVLPEKKGKRPYRSHLNEEGLQVPTIALMQTQKELGNLADLTLISLCYDTYQPYLKKKDILL